MDLNNGKFCFIENNHASMVNDRTNGLVTMLVDSKVSKCRSLCYQIPNQKPFQSVVKISPNRRNIFYGLMVFSITGIVILLIAVALSILYFRCKYSQFFFYFYFFSLRFIIGFRYQFIVFFWSMTVLFLLTISHQQA